VRIVIGGSRTFKDYNFFKNKVDEIFKDIKEEITIVSGKCPSGADAFAEKYAQENNIPFEGYPADWDKYGKSAGYIRNEAMAKVGQMLIDFWDGQSKGSKHMIDLGNKYNLDVRVIQYGKVYLTNIRGAAKLPEGTIKLFIARQPIQDMDKYGFKQVLELAPSYNLLRDYKNKKITWDGYVERFTEEMKSMIPTLKRIQKYTRAGHNIALICYCATSAQCHRGIIGQALTKQGIEVIAI
jgi:uncharacterized protein YeaO (DUF488 family)